MTPEKLDEIVNQSGFPLQIGIANLIDRTSKEHGWRVLYTEHSWKNEDGNSGFIDIAATNRNENCILVIECKRVLDSSWIFLQPGDKLDNRSAAKAWLTLIENKSAKRFAWVDLQLVPTSPEVGFCVVRGQDQKSTPMLERIAGELVSATESFAHEQKNILTDLGKTTKAYFSVIVTTARLQVCIFDPSKIDLHNGKLTESKFQEVPFVRFRKQLSTSVPEIETTDLNLQEALAIAKEHTIFVINSEKLLDFLHNLALRGE